MQCCTPALLLENGDAWELERCECHNSADPNFPVSCGGTNTDELLMGYIFFRWGWGIHVQQGVPGLGLFVHCGASVTGWVWMGERDQNHM